MNYSIIKYILGWVIFIEGSVMILPFITSIFYNEVSGVAFLSVSFICILIGLLLIRKKPKNPLFFAREGFVTVALSWIVLSIIGALPFTISGEIPNYIDALFETISGFTTTGASIVSRVENLSKCMLFWRSFTHWIGGMGVLVFILAIMPLAGGQSMHLMRAESPGPSVSKLVPNLRKTAFMLYLIYFFITLLQIIILVMLGQPLFDAICNSFATAGTGGFGLYSDSIAHYNNAQQNVITIFMLLFGVNFSFYYLLLLKRFKDAFNFEEVRYYFAIFAGAVLLITINLTLRDGNLIYNLQHAAFQSASIMTTTGFATVDFDTWPIFSKSILVLLMFVGACAGSTGGGIKISRILIYFKSSIRELSHLIHPNSVKTIKCDHKPISNNIIRSCYSFFIIYIIILTTSILLISIEGYDMATNFTAVATALNNVGPGLELVGPSCNFQFFNPFSKFILMFNMLAGRLEIFPILLMFVPSSWSKER